MPVILSSKSKRRNDKLDNDGSLIETSFKRFKITAEAESEWRKQALEDLKFSIGTGQWDESIKANREIEGKPCLTVNRAPAFLRQYTGEERQHRPAMLVSPVGSGADIETAKIHQGVLRHIEVVSVAENTYDSAYDMMMRIGGCPWRVKIDYTSETSFDQEPRIEAIENPFSVYLSPVRRPDGTDPLWGHVVTDYSWEKYEAEFPDSELLKFRDGRTTNGVSLRFATQMGNAEPSWVTKEGVRIAEYWWVDLTAKRLYHLDDGTTTTTAPKDKGLIVGERDTIMRTLNCVFHNAAEVLKKHDYVGKYLPFPECNGVRLNVNGKIYRAGMVRDYRDAQRIYDWMFTRAVEQIDMTTKDPLWVPEDNAQYGEEYRQMNRKNYSHLFYKAYDKDGRQLPPPQRAGKEATIQAMEQMLGQADYAMKSVIGIYGPSLGEEQGASQESGFAILERKEATNTAAIAWHENLSQAILWQGKILLDLWPKLINSARVQRIINPDDSPKHQVIFNSQNSPLENGQPPQDALDLLNEQMGMKKAYDVGVGDYDLVLSTGPMFQSAKKEAFHALTAVISENPQIMLPLVGDIWAENADFNGADRLAKRFKALIPPQAQDSDGDDLQSKLTQAQAQLQAMSAQHNQLVAEVNRANDTIRTKRLDLESRERVALWNNFTQLTLQRMKTTDAGAQTLLDHQLQAISLRMVGLHEHMPIEMEAGNDPNAPELTNAVEPKAQPVTPAAPTPRPQPV